MSHDDHKLDKIFKGHETIDHGKKEYAKGEVTINGIEGFWGYAQEGLLKHHGMSTENFPYYFTSIGTMKRDGISME